MTVYYRTVIVYYRTRARVRVRVRAIRVVILWEKGRVDRTVVVLITP